jgi:phospholipase/carboxylesterase
VTDDAAAGLERPHVFLPAEPGALGPPLLLLHGTGADEHDLLPLRDHLSPGAAVLSPRGTVLEAGMPRFFRRLQEGVFDEQDLALQAAHLATFVATASEHYGIAAGSLVAVGFSNGANIASALLMQHPAVVRGAVLLAAMIPYAAPTAAADLTGVGVVISNGLRDPMIPDAMTAELARQFRGLGAEVTELPHAGGHQIDAAMLPELAAIVSRWR